MPEFIRSEQVIAHLIDLVKNVNQYVESEGPTLNYKLLFGGETGRRAIKLWADGVIEVIFPPNQGQRHQSSAKYSLNHGKLICVKSATHFWYQPVNIGDNISEAFKEEGILHGITKLDI